MAPTYEAIKAHMVPFEGHVQHMYLDTVGEVTIGIGNMLPNVAAALKLRLVHRVGRQLASEAEIRSDFERVLAQPKGQRHTKYRIHTQLELPDPEIDSLFRGRIEGFRTALKGIYPFYEELPEPVQLALLDLIFNLGPTGLKREWPKLNAAVAQRDWAEAAAHSNRFQVQAERNDEVKRLFLAAASSNHRRSELQAAVTDEQTHGDTHDRHA